MNQTIYQIIAFLLRYPDRQMQGVLPEIQEEIEAIDNVELKSYLLKFLHQSADMTLDAWIDHYIDHFDFGKMTNLYVTYLKLGEQRERGLELLKLKKFFEANGFEITDKELPDYLPLILEFCANVPAETSNELLQMHYKAIAEIRSRLIEQKSYYHLLFDALFINMESNGLNMENDEQLVAEER